MNYVSPVQKQNTNRRCQIYYVGPLFSDTTCFDCVPLPSSGRNRFTNTLKRGEATSNRNWCKMFIIIKTVVTNYTTLLGKASPIFTLVVIRSLPDDIRGRQPKPLVTMNREPMQHICMVVFANQYNTLMIRIRNRTVSATMFRSVVSNIVAGCGWVPNLKPPLNYRSTLLISCMQYGLPAVLAKM
jgi:hypothetical protein